MVTIQDILEIPVIFHACMKKMAGISRGPIGTSPKPNEKLLLYTIILKMQFFVRCWVEGPE